MIRKKILFIAIPAVVATLYFSAMIPDSVPPLATKGKGDSFAWKKDAYWQRLEDRFGALQKQGCNGQVKATGELIQQANQRVHQWQQTGRFPGADETQALEQLLFDAAVKMAACKDAMTAHGASYERLRLTLKRLSSRWDIRNPNVRTTVYRLLYGSRIATEQAMLVSGIFPKVQAVSDAPRHPVPTVTVHGVTIQSGDLLLSRGTAPTSAFIARGNNYPGNFSHVALVHVSEQKKVSIIEAHIEGGVAVTDGEGYLRDKKFRILVLRLRNDLPAIQKNPTLPHDAATLAFNRANAGHTPYDFEMDYQNSNKLFCSEVASSVYAQKGINLWQALSHISNPVVVRWMRDFGVRHFITQAPSDLEYDP
ncbi:MAG: hypothetical protein JXR76_22220, partial [Deltaproteobacteria bacterium]|nr:hypothetical protein [Deltaproteobacteria bacterium]